MGTEFCLSSRFSSFHCAYPFSGGSVIDFKRRRPWPAREGCHGWTSIYRSIGIFVSMSPNCSLSHDDDQQRFSYPNRLPHSQPGFANIGCHGLGILPTAPDGDSNNEHPSSHSPIHVSSAEWEVSKIDSSSARGAVAGVGVPLSLRMLKRKQRGYGSMAFTQGLTDVGNSIGKAFASIIFILKELQIESIHIRQELCKQDVRSLLNQVHEDMHASFLWLFQQVFSCTPELMMLLMILLANFTAFSMANTLPMVTTPTTPTLAVGSALFGSLDASVWSKSDKGMLFLESRSVTSPCVGDDDWLLDHMGNGGRGHSKGCTAAGGGNGSFEPSKTSNSVNRALHSVDDNLFREFSSTKRASGRPISQAKLPYDVQILSDDASTWDLSSMASVFANKEKIPAVSILSESDALSGSSSTHADQDVQAIRRSQSAEYSNHAALAGHVLPSFVAPITTSIEDDNYTCYATTDLDYQYAISTSDANSMLLANYAQFLFLVRKDHDRAEELFRRALECDPLDSNATSQYASFLWLARHNITAAGKAYQAAVRAEPCNSFHAAEYAHFLWSSGQ